MNVRHTISNSPDRKQTLKKFTSPRRSTFLIHFLELLFVVFLLAFCKVQLRLFVLSHVVINFFVLKAYFNRTKKFCARSRFGGLGFLEIRFKFVSHIEGKLHSTRTSENSAKNVNEL